MRTTVIALLVAVTTGLAATAGTAEAAGARARSQRIKAAVARRTPRPVKNTVNRGLARLGRMRQAAATRRDARRGKALADVHRSGKTRVRSLGDLMWSPAVHGVVSYLAMVGLGFKAVPAAIGGGIVYLSSRSAKKTSDGWLAVENHTMDVLEREGPDAARQRLRNQGARDPDASLKRLQQNRLRRNASYQ